MQIKVKQGRAQGFSLLEVLVASIILFMFLAMAAQAFRQASISSMKAERSAKVAAVMPLLVEGVRQQLFKASIGSTPTGSGELQGIGYQWQAVLSQRSGATRSFDENRLQFVKQADRYNLWDVTLTLQLDSYQREWIYEELTWDR